MIKQPNYAVTVWSTKGTLCKPRFKTLREARVYAETMSATGKYMAYVTDIKSGMEISIYSKGIDLKVRSDSL